MNTPANVFSALAEKLAAPSRARARRRITVTSVTQFLREFAVGCAVFGMAIVPASVAAADAAPVPLALVRFDYVDTSGEPTDQQAKHTAHLDAFMSSLAKDLERSGRFRVVALECGSEPCSMAPSDLDRLLDAARRAGARYVVSGGIHKASTLISTGRAQMIDVNAERLAFDRTLSFRGDDQNAWQRAAAFLVKELVAVDLSSAQQGESRTSEAR